MTSAPSPPNGGGAGDADDRLGRVLRWLSRHLRRRPSVRVQRLLLVAAAVVFVVGGYVSIRALEVDLASIRWGPMALAALVGIPLSVVANAFEYLVSGRLLGQRIPPREALRVTTVAAAANLLPIPGAFVVRTQALQTTGSGYGRAAGVTFAMGLAWIGVPSLLTGLLLIPRGQIVVGGGFLVGGLVTLTAALAWILRNAPRSASRARLASLAVLAEAAGVVSLAIRLVFVLQALDIDADLGQAFVLSVSTSLASATGILPGGFGIRELIAALLSPLVGLTVAAGFAATAVNRVLGIVALAPVSLGLSGTAIRGEETDPPGDELHSAGLEPSVTTDDAEG